MANGDQAAAAGLPVVPSASDVRLGYDWINKLADSLANHIVNGGHAFSKITGQVTNAQITDASVTTSKVANASLTTAKYADASVTLAKMANNSVGTAQLVNGSVTQSKLAQRYAGGVVSTNPGTTVTVNTGMGAGTFAPTVSLLGVTTDPEKAYVQVMEITPSDGRFKFRVGSSSATPPLSVTVTWTAVQF